MKDYTILKAKIDFTKGRSDAFKMVARDLGQLIDGMDLSPVLHRELTNLTCKQINVAERDAFMFGFKMALKFMHDCYGKEEVE